jgi:DNA polymerase-3 subunit beta
MKATGHCEELLTACQLACAVIPPREVKPILKNIKAVAGEDHCTLMATDMEVGLRLDVQGLTIHEPGEAILPAARLLAILRETRDTELEIETAPSACIVKGPSLEFKLPSEDPSPFPDPPPFAEDKFLEITSGSLREMIRRTVFAVADETARYAIKGVLWELEGDALRLVATDGRRLALAQGTATGHGGHTTHGQAPIVPTKAMNLLERNLHDDEETVKICLRPNDVLFRTERAVVYSRLVEGRFPDYRQALPKKQAARVVLQPAAFQTAVRRAAIMTDEDSKRITFRFSKGNLTLSTQDATAGCSRVEMPIEYNGKTVEIAFPPTPLLDLLKVLPSDAELTLDLIDASSPALFRSGPDYSYWVSPLTTSPS